MSSRHRSQRTLSNGLWSTAKIKFSQPRTKKRALSKALATANVSPSMGAYLGSAGCVKRLPTSVIFQPVRQQKGLTEVQSQCFWNNQYPMPCFDHSVATGGFRFIKDSYAIFDFLDDGGFRLFEELLEVLCPGKWGSWF